MRVEYLKKKNYFPHFPVKSSPAKIILKKIKIFLTFFIKINFCFMFGISKYFILWKFSFGLALSVHTTSFFFFFRVLRKKRSCSWLRNNAARHSPPLVFFLFLSTFVRWLLRVLLSLLLDRRRRSGKGDVGGKAKTRSASPCVHYQPVAPRCQVCSLSTLHPL